MVVVEIPSTSTYSNLYTLSEFPAGTSLILTNNTSSPAFIVQASVPPLASSDQYPLLPGQTVLVHANADPIWVRGGKGPFLVQTMLETITPFTGVDLPHDLYTSKNERFRRIQVDVAQTGNDEGREFRTFKRINIPNGSTEYLRFVSPINFILWDERVMLSDGWIDSTAYRIVDNVAGTWTDLPQIGRNISSDRPLPFYTPQAKLQTGGTFTFLAANEVGPPIIVRTSSATAQASSIPSGNSRERILGAGTYYLKLTSLGNSNAVGCYYLDWEERP
jgi:hypothetical protein